MRIKSSSDIIHTAAEQIQQGGASSPSGAARAAPVRGAMLTQLPRRNAAAVSPTAPQSDLRAKINKRALEAPSSEAPRKSRAKRPRLEPLPGSGAASVPRSRSPQLQPSLPQAGIAMPGPSKVIRRNLTAEIVYQILAKRSEGMSSREVAQAYGVSTGSVESWSSKKTWETRHLAPRLSRMPDYAPFREKLNVLAKQLELTTHDLPPSAESQRTMDASRLTKGLKAIVEMQAHRGPGRGKGPNVLRIAGQAAGCDISYWLKVDGALRLPLSAVARLIGYREQREELQRLFASLGHVQTAERLPMPGDESIKRMTAALLVEALTMLKGNPDLLLREIGISLGLDGQLLSKFGVGNDGSLRDSDMLQKLPDYAEHREPLGVALRTLGHQEQASSLPLATIDAEQLLQSLRSDFNRFAAALRAMQRDPKLSAHDAALQAGVSFAALGAMIDCGGAMRERHAVHALLTHFHDHLTPGVDAELERLHAVALGKAPMSAPANAMKATVVSVGGVEPDKVFIVRSNTADPGAGRRDRLKILYANNPDQVAEQRSFAADRPRQALRWLSTVLKQAFPKSKEIQCYYHASNQEIVVASNVSTTNQRLDEKLRQGGLISIIEDLCGRGAEEGGIQEGRREARHLEKLLSALLADQENVGPRALRDVLAAMSRGRFRVTVRNFSQKSRTIDLHAERRIKRELERTADGPLQLSFLAGTMRPCGACAEDLEFADTEHRGPFWQSASSQAWIDTPRAIERNVSRGIGTYVTKTRAGELTLAYDTDSDSDIEQTELRMQGGSLRDEHATASIAPSDEMPCLPTDKRR